MGESGEIWRGMREESQAVRQKRYSVDVEKLVRSGLKYETHNGGNHLVVTGLDGRAFDYWPSTGKVHERTKGARYEQGGIRRLLTMCGFAADDIAALDNGATREPVQPVSKTDPLQTAIDGAPMVIQYAARMSRYAVWAYEQAGFIVMGKPEETKP